MFHAQKQNQLWKMKVHPILFVSYVKFHHLNENKSFWFFSQRSCRRDIHATMQKWKKNAYRILGTPSDPVPAATVRFYPWGLGRSRLAVKSGHPKWVSSPQRRGEVSIIKGVGKVGFCFWWVVTTLYLCKIFGSIPGWSCLWYLTILL